MGTTAMEVEPSTYNIVGVLFQFNVKALYACWRVFWAVYHMTWVLLSWVLEPWVAYPAIDRLKWFVYLTNWMYLLLALETVIEAINFLYVHLLRYDIVKGESRWVVSFTLTCKPRTNPSSW